jgi:hypothetical protein
MWNDDSFRIRAQDRHAQGDAMTHPAAAVIPDPRTCGTCGYANDGDAGIVTQTVCTNAASWHAAPAHAEARRLHPMDTEELTLPPTYDERRADPQPCACGRHVTRPDFCARAGRCLFDTRDRFRRSQPDHHAID